MSLKDTAQAKLQGLELPQGKYRHYKGGEYEVITCAVKEDTLEPLVIYRSLVKGYVWARTLSNWNETVEVDGRSVQRFQKIPE